jgi:hypothetical protein
MSNLSSSAALHCPGREERGDIAGWVMITVMTIMLAVAISAIFMPAVTDYLQSALDQFS